MMVAGVDTTLQQFTVDSLFSKFDAFKLAPVLGTIRSSTMLRSEKIIHTFVTTSEGVS